jgi:hypothetical protein
VLGNRRRDLLWVRRLSIHWKIVYYR